MLLISGSVSSFVIETIVSSFGLTYIAYSGCYLALLYAKVTVGD